ncbi:MAG: glycosyltransferase family 2 protein [Burkholderiaceae bacterium]
MNENPYFSVCIPTYNYAQFLPEAIDSVLGQTFSDFELLIQDNCSTDTTDSVIEKYNDPRISYQKNGENIGMYGNLNKVCARAKGKYIKVLCADDIMSKWCLETIFELLKSQSTDCELISVKETSDRPLIDQEPLLSEVNCFFIDRNNLFSYLSEQENWGAGLAELCVKRIFFQTVGYFGTADSSKDFSKDIITWLNMALKTEALMIDQPLIFQRPHAGQSRYSLSRLPQLEEMLNFFNSCQLEYSTYKDFEKAKQNYLGGYVVSHCWAGFKAMVRGQGTTYFLEVRALLTKYQYDNIPFAPLIGKIKQRFVRLSN